MTDYTARKVLLKNSAGEYVIPYTEKMERDLSDLSAAGTTALLAKVHTDGAVAQYWSADLTPTAGKTIVLYESGGILSFYRNTTGTNTATTPDQDTTNWTVVPMGATVSTPASATDNSTAIATTAWVRNHCCTTAATTSSTASKDAPAYVVKNYRSGNNWYRVWSDGWIEQGGRFQTSTTSFQAVNLNKAFAGTDYKILLTGYNGVSTGNTPVVNTATGTKTKTAFSAFFYTGLYSDWYACGY